MTASAVDHDPGYERDVQTGSLRIHDPGPRTTIQDLGRPGYAHLGVTGSGAADRSSLRLANRLVGNPEGAAALENTLGGLTFELTTDHHVAITGAPVSVRVDGTAVIEPARLYLLAGQRVQLGRPGPGLHTYLAVAGGGLDVAAVLGSASRDCLAGIGPDPVRPGQIIGLRSQRPVAIPILPLELIAHRIPTGHCDVSFRWGPRDALFSPADRGRFTSTDWLVTSQSDRVGARLSGPPLAIGEVHLPSEGMATGAIQIPPSGTPIVFLADHPVTGGYPVIGVVTEQDIDLLAQAAPGTAVRFTART
jgi:biotin-dependent carboxylase-like uncharacterized protein